MKPSNSPNQGQPNPRKIRSKSGTWATFLAKKYFFVGWDCFFLETDYKKPNPIKFSAKTPYFYANIEPMGIYTGLDCCFYLARNIVNGFIKY